MPAALFRAGKKRSFGLYISSVPDGTLIIARINGFVLSKSYKVKSMAEGESTNEIFES
jgi:hypothetical protein